jgi:hypothetical protein
LPFCFPKIFFDFFCPPPHIRSLRIFFDFFCLKICPRPKIANLNDKVFAKNDPKPASTLELATKLASAINAKIRGDATAAALMEGVGIEAAPFEGGTMIRVRTTPLGPAALSKRLSDATAGRSMNASCVAFACDRR